MTDEHVVDVVRALTPADLHKSMTAHFDHGIWQDAYKPKAGERVLNVKFTVDAAGALFLISFKEA